MTKQTIKLEYDEKPLFDRFSEVALQGILAGNIKMTSGSESVPQQRLIAMAAQDIAVEMILYRRKVLGKK